MKNPASFNAVIAAIGGKDNFCGYVNAIVRSDNCAYTYKNVFVSVNYNYGYDQMELSIDWDKDSSKPSYKTLGLHAGYNSNYQIFQCRDQYKV